MKHLLFSLSALLLCVVAGCSSDVPSPEDYSTPMRIEPMATIYETDGDATSRVPINGTGGKNHNISLFRADQPYTTAYQNTPTAGTITTDSKVTTALYYLSEPTKTSRLLGIYPAVGTNIVWNATNRKITYSALDGKTDVLCSQLIEGSKKNPMKDMVFDHLLTRVDVYIKSYDALAGTHWGTIKSITLKGAKGGMVVTLPVANTTTTGAKVSTDSSTATDKDYYPLRTLTDGTPATTIKPEADAAYYGYTMFPPKTTTATDKLELVVETASNGDFTVPLPTRTYAAGKMHTATLEFTITAIEVSNVKISSWTDNNTDLDTIPIY